MATGELAAEVVEEVALNLEEAATSVRRIDAKALGFLLLGVGIGCGIGFVIGYRYNKEKLRAEAFQQSAEEVEEIRAFYRESRVVESPKPDLEDVVAERRYGLVEETDRPLPAPVPVLEPYQARGVGPPKIVRTEENEKDKNEGWSYPYELSQRRPNKPFIIHQDEFFGEESGYQHVTYTYYEGDDILADEDETVLNNRQNLIGDAGHLTRFGHGTDDFNTLYIRNSHLELEIEIVRDPGSYEMKVQDPEDETNGTDAPEPA